VVFARWRQCASHVTHAFFGPPESTTQTASRSVQPFLHSSRQSVAPACPFLYKWLLCMMLMAVSDCSLQRAAPSSLIIAPSHGGSEPPSNTWFMGAHLISQSKQHLDSFSRFYTAHSRVSLYFAMGRRFTPQNCPFLSVIWTTT